MKSASLKHRPALGTLYDLMTGDEDARVCKDIPESACRHQPRNFFAYLAANLLGKIADELSSARLVLPWLLATLGAPAAFVGFLVPIREAGVLLPQLAVAAYVRRLAQRKTVWLLGAALSAAALLCMALAIGSLTGATAGWAVLALLSLFSLARGLCSVSAKDVLGKTVSKTRRGALMGYSAAAAGVVTLLLGAYVEWLRPAALDIQFFQVFLLLAAGIWLLAIASFAGIREAPGATEGGGNAFTAAMDSLALIRTDLNFRRYVVARILLLSIALSPPFYVLLAQQKSGGAAGLGMLIVASGLASALSAPIWGRLGDRSSKKVMIVAAGGAAVLGFTLWIGDRLGHPWLEHGIVHAVLFTALIVCHSGARLGRKIYLVDMATPEHRASFVAVSNTLVGGAMLMGGAVGVVADVLDVAALIGLLGTVSAAGALYMLRMRDVSG